MAIQSPAEAAKAVDLIEKQSQKLVDAAKKSLGAYKKKSAEFETIRGGLLEGADEIKRLHKELEDAYSTFDKMTTKLEGLTKDLEGQGKDMRAVQKQVNDTFPDLRDLAKDCDKLLSINKGNTMLKDAKKTCENVDKLLDDTRNELTIAAGDCEGLPGPVARPK